MYVCVYIYIYIYIYLSLSLSLSLSLDLCIYKYTHTHAHRNKEGYLYGPIGRWTMANLDVSARLLQLFRLLVLASRLARTEPALQGQFAWGL